MTREHRTFGETTHREVDHFQLRPTWSVHCARTKPCRCRATTLDRRRPNLAGGLSSSRTRPINESGFRDAGGLARSNQEQELELPKPAPDNRRLNPSLRAFDCWRISSSGMLHVFGRAQLLASVETPGIEGVLLERIACSPLCFRIDDDWPFEDCNHSAMAV